MIIRLKICFIVSVLLGLLVLLNVGYAEKLPGNLIIKNYSSKEFGAGDQNWVINQGPDGRMFFGNTDGLLIYDGITWKLHTLPNNSVLRSIDINHNGKLYVGGQGEFGYYLPDLNGNLTYHSLSENLDSSIEFDGDVWKTYVNGDSVYFCTVRHIFLFVKDKLFKVYNLHQNSSFLTFKVESDLYVGDWTNGLLKLGQDSLESIKGGSFFREKNIFAILPYNDTSKLIVTYNSGSFIFNLNSGNSKVFETNTNLLIDRSVYAANISSDGIYYFGSTESGIYAFNREGKFQYHIEKENGLIGSVVTSMYFGREGNLWVTLDNGISQVYMPEVFTSFNDQSGLKGTIYSIEEFNNQMFIGTSTGIFNIKSNSSERAINEFKNIGSQVWDLEKVTFNGVPYLLCGTNYGLYEIDQNFGIRNVEATLRDDITKKFIIRSVNQNPFNEGEIFLGTERGITIFSHTNGMWQSLYETDLSNEIRNIEFISDDEIWLSTYLDGLIKMKIEKNNYTFVPYKDEKGLPNLVNLVIEKFRDTLLIGTEGGIYYYNQSKDTILPYNTLKSYHTDKVTVTYIANSDNQLYLFTNHQEKNNIEKITFNSLGYIKEDRLFKILPLNTIDAIYQNNNYTVLGLSSELFFYNPAQSPKYFERFHSLINKVVIGRDSVLFNGNFYSGSNDSITGYSLFQPKNLFPRLDYKLNNVTFFVSAPYYVDEEHTKFCYYLDGNDSEWSPWTDETKIVFTNLSEGRYEFQVKARNIFGIESTIRTFEFHVSPPWYRTILAYFIYAVISILIIILFIKWYTRRLVKEKQRLEMIVEERTREIKHQKEKIEYQNKEITDSIRYAQRIQRAVLPSKDKAARLLNDNYFILFKPRDIVSGDFYWMAEQGGKVVIIAADCTGHGVPGAFMSMLGVSFLNEIVNRESITQANLILNELRNSVKLTLGQTGKADEAKDGMDVALCIIDFHKMELQYSGAYNPLLLVRDGEIIQYKADRNPIGIHISELTSFTNHVIDLKKGDTFYIFSDGFTDQFGGEEGRKFMMKPFKRLLEEIQDKPMNEQYNILNDSLLSWMGEEFSQIDDILVIGVRI